MGKSGSPFAIYNSPKFKPKYMKSIALAVFVTFLLLFFFLFFFFLTQQLTQRLEIEGEQTSVLYNTVMTHHGNVCVSLDLCYNDRAQPRVQNAGFSRVFFRDSPETIIRNCT
ncbi:hypothetical protein P5V15_003619 [Pogonomyrmex californicus]